MNTSINLSKGLHRFIFIFLLIWLIPNNIMGQSALEIIKKADNKMRGNTSQAELAIIIVRPNWSREIGVKAWMKGTEYSMILIQSPIKDKGIVFLKRGKEVWNWIPTLERSIKLPPSMMSQSWMGTDFTNDDLVKESSIIEDYKHTIIGDTLIRNRSCFIIQMIPKPETAIVWSKVITCIDKKDYLELHTSFYDEDGILINILNSYDIKAMDGRLIPTRREMIPVGKKKQKTEIIYKKILFDRPLDKDFFILNKMKNLN